MIDLTAEQNKSANKILDVLIKRTTGMDDKERTRYIYNSAIDDASHFASDMAVTNPQHRLEFESLSREIRKWMTIPREDQ